MELHSVYVLKNNWTPNEFREYLKSHNLTPIKPIRIYGNQYRARIRPPAYKSYITRKIITTVKRHTNSLRPENRIVFYVMGIGTPDKKYNRHLHDFAYQNKELKN